jgi:hypothetical protein
MIALDELLSKLSLPLNILGNSSHPFYPSLKAIRAAAREAAIDLPIVAQ